MGVTEGLPWEDKLTALHHGAQPFNGRTVPHPCESVLCRTSPGCPMLAGTFSGSA